MEYAIAKVSTKGQIVIPTSMRDDIKAGDEFLIVKDSERLVFKNLKKVAKDLKDDLEFARRTEEAWKRFEAGKFKSMEADEFLKELKKW
ncbi:AbrB/MazE/SpoVT family DNA-binding domain-containing protein [Candidatus Woesearchaeota archaeon]|nr:AbrB/MazE/SpoVT family DNA-binding domain-containing protein [Candidatus Woesearchaeota archaeon]